MRHCRRISPWLPVSTHTLLSATIADAKLELNVLAFVFACTCPAVYESSNMLWSDVSSPSLFKMFLKYCVSNFVRDMDVMRTFSDGRTIGRWPRGRP
jgi:hypothetical protein